MKRLLFAFGFSLIVFVSAFGQNISGVINTYSAVNSVNLSSVTVISSTGFSVGEKVLIIEMQGATIDQTNTTNFGNITSYGNAGNHEFDTIASIGGNLITFTHDLCKIYDVPGNIQLVSVPVYTNPTITNTLTCQPWNGSTGGILVFQASGTVTMNANIDVSMLGFRGGNFVNSYFLCGDYNYYLLYANYYAYSGGEKGESISEYITNENGGMGKQANGGGGGQPGNSGGGGGGNYGSGGMGGNEYNGCGTTGVQGYGGVALSNTGNKIFMGGGGGGGLADNGRPVTAGGNGGAIVYIITNTLVGNSNTIVDTGQSVTGIASDESSGGGGAGGSVLLNIPNYTTPVTINVRGGYGGSGYNILFPTGCHGTGGGGGGGLIWLSSATISPNITFLSKSGAPGVMLNPQSACFEQSFGATTGDSGIVQTKLPPVSGLPSVNIGKDTTICSGTSILLNASDTFASYEWQNGSTSDTLTANSSGKYSVTVIDSFGCKDSATVQIKIEKPINFNFGNDTSSSSGSTSGGVSDTSICPGKQVLLQAPIGFVSYLWQNSTTNSSLIANIAGTYYVTVTDSFGCKGSDTMSVAIYPKPLVNIGKDTILCPGNTLVLNTKEGFKSYLWQNGSTDSSLTVSTLGEYSVIVTDTNGCIASDSVLISACKPEIHFPDAFTPGSGDINAYFIGYGSDITEYDLKIFNRWGSLIFETNDINSGWDGRYNGLPEPIGVYVYEVQYSGTDKVPHLAKGNITLLR